MLQIMQFGADLPDVRSKILVTDKRLCTAVIQVVTVILWQCHGAHWYWNGVDLHSTKVTCEELRAVREADHHPVFPLHAQAQQGVAQPVGGFG